MIHCVCWFVNVCTVYMCWERVLGPNISKTAGDRLGYSGAPMVNRMVM